MAYAKTSSQIQHWGAFFLTAVTFRRTPFFGVPACASLFCEELEAARVNMGFHGIAFVVMPNHVHLLLWWDADALPHLTISRIAWAVKGKSARRIVDYLKAGVGGVDGVGDGNRVGVDEGSVYPTSQHRNF